MTARDLIELAERHSGILTLCLLAPAVLVPLIGWIHGPERGRVSPWRYAYAVIVYLACILGIGAAVLTAFTFFFTHENLLDKNLLVYGLPLLSMLATLGLVRRQVSFDDVPGFDRLSGLMVLIGVAFVVVLALRRTFVGIFFGGSLASLVALGALVFGLLKWGAQLAFRKGGSPPPRSPLT